MSVDQRVLIFFFFFLLPFASLSCVFLARAFVRWSSLYKSVSAIDVNNNWNLYSRVSMCPCHPLQKSHICIQKYSNLALLSSGGGFGTIATVFGYTMIVYSCSLLPLWLLGYWFLLSRRRSRRRVLAIHHICQPSKPNSYQLPLPSLQFWAHTVRLMWALVALDQQNSEVGQSSERTLSPC